MLSTNLRLLQYITHLHLHSQRFFRPFLAAYNSNCVPIKIDNVIHLMPSGILVVATEASSEVLHIADQWVLNSLVSQAAKATLPALVSACASLLANLARAPSLRLPICQAPHLARCFAHAENADSHTAAIVLRLAWNLAGMPHLGSWRCLKIQQPVLAQQL